MKTHVEEDTVVMNGLQGARRRSWVSFDRVGRKESDEGGKEEKRRTVGSVRLLVTWILTVSPWLTSRTGGLCRKVRDQQRAEGSVGCGSEEAAKMTYGHVPLIPTAREGGDESCTALRGAGGRTDVILRITIRRGGLVGNVVPA